MKTISAAFIGACAFVTISHSVAWAWDYEGHRAVNQLALATLSKDFPAFALTPASRERIAFLAGEPDRWRNTQDLTLRHCNEPDHYLDAEYLAGFGLQPEVVPPFRYDFMAYLAVVRSTNSAIEPVIVPEKDKNHTRANFGFLPWTINEQYSKLKAGFSYLKAYTQYGGTAEEIANAQANIIYVMGVMGHFVGDAAQPLHTTKYHNGWEGPNPKGFSTRRTFHGWIDGGYFNKVGLPLAELLTNAQPAKIVPGANSQNLGIFQPTLNFILAQNQLVEPLYQLEKDGKLSGDGTLGLGGQKFLNGQLLKAGQMLGDIWLTAWQTAPEDGYLKSQLLKRSAATRPENSSGK